MVKSPKFVHKHTRSNNSDIIRGLYCVLLHDTRHFGVDMHKELLFALLGFEGNVFVRDRESGNMKVREDGRKV